MATFRRALFPLLLLLATASAACAQDALDQRYERGKRLGGGTYKVVYAIKDHPDLVLILVKKNRKGDTLSKEKAFLDELDQKGVPVAKILEVGTWGDHVAGIQKRYEVSDRDVMAYTEKQWDLLNESSLADADKIWKALEAAKIDIKDPQYLVAKDGHIVLNDPLGLEPLPAVNEDSHTFRLLRALRMDARQAIEMRKLLEDVKKIPGADDPLLAPYFAKRYVDYIAWDDKKTEAKVREALLHYLETGSSTDEARRVAKAVRDGKITLGLRPDYDEEPGPNEIKVHAGQSFFVMASQLVSVGTAKLDGTAGLEGEVVAHAKALAFLQAKEVPDGTGQGAVHARGAELRADPSKLVSLLDKGKSTDPAEHARLTKLAAGILARPRGPSPTDGLGGVLERSLDRERGVEER